MFRDRKEVGMLLAERLKAYSNSPDAIVLGLPRGGVPVAHEVGKALGLPVDAFVVRKLGVPWHKEVAMGAIAEGGFKLLNKHFIDEIAVDDSALEGVLQKEQAELARREKILRSGRKRASAHNKIVLLIDDGLATGATMKVAIAAIRTEHPTKLVVAVPVSPIDTAQEIKELVDEFICLSTPETFWGVSGAYESFPQVSDEEVTELLK